MTIYELCESAKQMYLRYRSEIAGTSLAWEDVIDSEYRRIHPEKSLQEHEAWLIADRARHPAG